ncbi:MAG: hypothetical protein WBE76_14080 [Terracidiphilus sp.]
MVKTMRPIWLGAASVLVSVAAVAQAPSPWEQPAAALAEQVAGILGPGQARLTIRDASTIPANEIPAIRSLLEQDLKARGVQTSGAESASTIRVTLSENVRERLWVAEVIEGSETHVAMVHVEAAAPQPIAAVSGLTLRKQTALVSKQPVLAALEMASGLVVIEPEWIVFYGKTADGWQEQKRVAIGQKRALARDPRAEILPNVAGNGFEAFVAGMECDGNFATGTENAQVKCHDSDDPWPIAPLSGAEVGTEPIPASTAGTVKAFYNSSRNFFTGVITPGLDVDLPAFYSAEAIPLSPGLAAFVLTSIDGRVQRVQGGTARPVSGTRDWGSDFAVLHSGCGAGYQVIASGSGEAASDSLRAYELPAQEAVPASAPLAVDGTVMTMWNAPDGKSVLAVVRKPAGDYEVDRVTALCG